MYSHFSDLYVAAKLGISLEELYSKIDNPDQFTEEERAKMKEAMDIDVVEFLQEEKVLENGAMETWEEGNGGRDAATNRPDAIVERFDAAMDNSEDPCSAFNANVVLPFMNDEGAVQGEIVQAVKEGDYYRIQDIPLHASKFALYDLLEVVDREGVLYYKKIIESWDRHVIQMMIFNEADMKIVEAFLERLGCNWRWNKEELLIAFDVAKHVAYEPIKEWLEMGEREKRWGYREACLSKRKNSN